MIHVKATCFDLVILRPSKKTDGQKLFSFPTLCDPKCSQLGSVFLECPRMTEYVETRRPNIYTIVHKINFLLLTDV